MIELGDKAPAELAEEIARFPDGYDFREERELQKLLTGQVEERNPLKYAEIFRAVAARDDISPWMKFAARSEDINGRRRAKGAQHAEIVRELSALAEEISGGLPESREKSFLLGGIWWDAAILNRNLRRYREAAAAQRRSSSWYGLGGYVEKYLIGIFAAQVEEVTASFEGKDDVLIRRDIEALVAARNLVRSALPDYPSWMKTNAPVHIAWAVMMAELRGVYGIDSKNYREDFAESRNSSMPQWARVFQVWEDYRQGRYKQVTGAAPVDLPSSSADNAALTVQILVGLAERKLSRPEQAQERLRAVANHSGANGGIPIAVAAVMLQ
jgi:uncharacterized protein YbjQ (UPF0145 family)